MAAINVHESKMVDLQGWVTGRVALTTYIDPKCQASAGCYFLYGHLLPPSDRAVAAMKLAQPKLRIW